MGDERFAGQLHVKDRVSGYGYHDCFEKGYGRNGEK